MINLFFFRYSKETLSEIVCKYGNFELINHQIYIHNTPFNTQQEFIFCIFQRKPR